MRGFTEIGREKLYAMLGGEWEVTLGAAFQPYVIVHATVKDGKIRTDKIPTPGTYTHARVHADGELVWEGPLTMPVTLAAGSTVDLDLWS